MVKNKLEPRFSIITVVHNDRKHIEGTIKSVLEQTYPNFEYIIIDGGSTDGTLDVIKKYKNRIDSWVSEPDKGIYDAMNKGIQKSTGDLLYFLNSNDYFHNKDVLKNVANEYLANDKPDILYGRLFLQFNHSLKQDGVREQVSPEKRFLSGEGICHQATFMKKSVFEEVGLFDTNYLIAADHDFFCRCYVAGINFICIPDIIARYNMEGRSSNSKLLYKEYKGIIKKYFSTIVLLRFWFRSKIVGDVKQGVESFIKRIFLFLRMDRLMFKIMSRRNSKKIEL